MNLYSALEFKNDIQAYLTNTRRICCGEIFTNSQRAVWLNRCIDLTECRRLYHSNDNGQRL
jgi:hypothetical protein